MHCEVASPDYLPDRSRQPKLYLQGTVHAGSRCRCDSRKCLAEGDLRITIFHRPMEFILGEVTGILAMTYPGVDIEWSTNGAHPDARSFKCLKTWSGRRDSNPRRPAWEDDRKLETKNIAFSACRSGDTVCPVFTLCPPRASNGAQMEHTKPAITRLEQAGDLKFSWCCD